MHYYQHHIGDFLRDTSHLSNDQIAVYLKMLWRYYDTEKPLPDDCEGIAFAVRSDEKTVGLLLRYFFQLAQDGWHHKRCDAEIAAYQQKSKKARFSANARWANANAMRTHTDRNANEPKNDANQEPRTINQEKEKINKKEKPAAPRRDVEIPEGVLQSTWADWLQLRKAKRAPVTQTAVEQIEREAVKAGWTLEQALAESTARGWTGFKADWLTQQASPAALRKTQHQINAEATARALGYGQSNGGFFDVIGECHEVKADVAARLGGSDF